MEVSSLAVGSRENRGRMRILCSTKVELVGTDDGIVAGELHDISLSGMYCFLPQAAGVKMQAGQNVMACLIMEQGSSSLRIEALAQIVRGDEVGAALIFQDPLVWWPLFTMFRKPAGQAGRHQEPAEEITIQ